MFLFFQATQTAGQLTYTNLHQYTQKVTASSLLWYGRPCNSLPDIDLVEMVIVDSDI